MSAVDRRAGIPIAVTELRRRLIVLRGKRVRSKNDRPKPGQGKSSTFRTHDIALLARVYRNDLSNFINNKVTFGPTKLSRLYKALIEVEGGLVTKSQYGVYHFHDTPQRPPVRVMQLNLGTGRISMVKKEKEPGKMPSFDKLFGG